MRLNKFLFALLILFGFCTVAFGQPAAPGDRAAAAVSQLWSQNDSDRVAAKQALLKLGDAAVPPLRALLEGLVRNPIPRFALGQEQEGAEHQRRFANLSSANTLAEALEDLRWIREVNINQRLRKDAAGLLAQLNPQELVSMLLPQLLSDYDAAGEWAVAALADARARVVPNIIELFGTARDTALAHYADEIKSSTEDLAWKVDWKAGVFQTRLVTALGEIGDRRALSMFLMFDPGDNVALRRAIYTASRRIMENTTPTSLDSVEFR